jgi:hypothetical protein
MYYTLKDHFWWPRMKMDVRLCGEMSDMSPGEGGTSEAFRNVTTVRYPRMEMGENHNEFCDEITQDKERA